MMGDVEQRCRRKLKAKRQTPDQHGDTSSGRRPLKEKWRPRNRGKRDELDRTDRGRDPGGW